MYIAVIVQWKKEWMCVCVCVSECFFLLSLVQMCMCEWCVCCSICCYCCCCVFFFFFCFFLSFLLYSFFLYSFSSIFVCRRLSIVYRLSLMLLPLYHKMHWLRCWFSRTVNRHTTQCTYTLHLYSSTKWPSLNGTYEYINCRLINMQTHNAQCKCNAKLSDR